MVYLLICTMPNREKKASKQTQLSAGTTIYAFPCIFHVLFLFRRFANKVFMAATYNKACFFAVFVVFAVGLRVPA